MQRWDLDINNQIFIMLFPYVWNPFKNILMTFETFLMVSISLVFEKIMIAEESKHSPNTAIAP